MATAYDRGAMVSSSFPSRRNLSGSPRPGEVGRQLPLAAPKRQDGDKSCMDLSPWHEKENDSACLFYKR